MSSTWPMWFGFCRMLGCYDALQRKYVSAPVSFQLCWNVSLSPLSARVVVGLLREQLSSVSCSVGCTGISAENSCKQQHKKPEICGCFLLQLSPLLPQEWRGFSYNKLYLPVLDSRARETKQLGQQKWARKYISCSFFFSSLFMFLPAETDCPSSEYLWKDRDTF